MSAENISLRLARRSDAPILARMSRDLVEAGLGWHYRTERIGQLIDDRETVVLVARSGLSVAGFAIMSFGDQHAHLVLLAVRAPHQRRGIARRMTHWLLESAATAGMACVHVELRADNKAAYAFYRNMGFAETRRLPGYYRGREEAIRMLRVLRVPGIAVQAWRPPTLDKR